MSAYAAGVFVCLRSIPASRAATPGYGLKVTLVAGKAGRLRRYCACGSLERSAPAEGRNWP